MNFQELLGELKKHPLQEIRACTDKYFEAVVSLSKLIGVENLLVSHFGVPLKPAGMHPSPDAKHCSKIYGGIRQSQTMYFRKKEEGNEVALLWPWECQTLVTLKVILEERPDATREASKLAWFKSLWNKVLRK